MKDNRKASKNSPEVNLDEDHIDCTSCIYYDDCPYEFHASSIFDESGLRNIPMTETADVLIENTGGIIKILKLF